MNIKTGLFIMVFIALIMVLQKEAIMARQQTNTRNRKKTVLTILFSVLGGGAVVFFIFLINSLINLSVVTWAQLAQVLPQSHHILFYLFSLMFTITIAYSEPLVMRYINAIKPDWLSLLLGFTTIISSILLLIGFGILAIYCLIGTVFFWQIVQIIGLIVVFIISLKLYGRE
jgi:hypothetical protein